MRTVLGRMLIQRGATTESEVAAALREQRSRRLRIGELLVERGVDADTVGSALADQLRLAFAAAPLAWTADALACLDAELARRAAVVPLALRDGALVVATAEPLDLATLDALRFRTGRRVEPVVASPAAIQAALAAAYQERAVAALLAKLPPRPAPRPPTGLTGDHGEDVGSLRRASEAPPIVGLVDLLFARALDSGASDVHIEPGRRGMRVRVRVDGALRELLRLPLEAAPGVVSRLKVLAALDIAERRRPQDGRATVRAGARAVAARVSTLPSLDGEKIVVRLLDTRDVVRPLDELGLAAAPLARLRAMIARPHGLVLVTGPTGSGKTTTLYAALAGIDRETRNVVTLEDPVEYRLPGLTQVQIHVKAGLDFTVALRAVLRQDPDVIMVGELRDRETARIALAAAMTGHLVLATLHTNDAPSAAARLLDMGAPPYLVAAALVGVVAQRLVRTCCPACRAARAEAHGAAAQPRSPICPRCSGRGLAGRIGIYEVMPVGERLRALIGRRASTGALRAAALDEGMQPLEADARAKLEDGLTTAQEVAPLIALPEDPALR
jgi:type IV pilus assembly protein PilB